MNSTFTTWLLVAGAAALGLLLLFGAPAGEATDAQTQDVNVVHEETDFWEPVTQTAEAAPATYVLPVQQRSTVSAPCTACGIQSQVPAPYPPAAAPIMPTPTPCSTCGSVSHVARAPMPQVPAPSPCGAVSVATAGGCGSPVSPCPSPSCPNFGRECGTCGSCASTCNATAQCALRPGINRNMDLCVDECSFIQLHATVPQPICDRTTFLWEATKGSFLNPTSADPIYYAPTTQFPGGEDVWVVLTVIDADGARYNDQVKIHVNDAK